MFKKKIKPNKINFQIPKGPIQVIFRLYKSDNKIESTLPLTNKL
jgi:hypothetical protein